MNRHGKTADAIVHQPGAVRCFFHRIHMRTIDLGQRPHQGSLAAGACAQIKPTSLVRPLKRGLHNSTSNQLAAFILDRRHALTDRFQLAGVTTVQIHGIG